MANSSKSPAEIADLDARLKSRLIAMPNGCVEWTRSTVHGGYGWFSFKGTMVRAHRVAWELANGPIPDGIDICHHCDNPPCCQTEPTEGYPEGHLFAGTHADNMADMVAKGRSGTNQNTVKTHCKNGHEFTSANAATYPSGGGGRNCLECRKTRDSRKSRATNPGPLSTHCKAGHEFTEANTYTRPNGWRHCKTCVNARAREARARSRITP